LNILVVEDDDPKRKNILDHVVQIVPGSTIVEARSVNSALRYLQKSQVDLVLLDMSLPSFDVGPGETGGRPQGFGGIEVLRSMDRGQIVVPVIVITAYEAFPSGDVQITLETLQSNLQQSHPTIFRGLVFYNSVFSAWSDQLSDLIRKAIGDYENSNS
jgi:CheY-like chemotaxis protein